MKKVYLALAMILTILLTGCGAASQTATTETEIHYADEDFIADLATGLQSRWDTQPANGATEDEILTGSDEHKQYYTDLVDAELNVLEKYQSMPFGNSKLQEYAISYINCLKQQKEAASYITTSYETYEEKWEEAYNNRTKLIVTFVNDYGLKVDEAHQATLDDFIAREKVIKEDEKVKTTIDSMMQNLTIEVTKDEYDWKTYEAVLENNTGKDFDYFGITLNIYDSDKVQIDSLYAQMQNWKNGTKAKFEFSTDKDFSSYDAQADWNITQ